MRESLRSATCLEEISVNGRMIDTHCELCMERGSSNFEHVF